MNALVTALPADSTPVFDPELAAIAKLLRKLQDEMNDIFPERDVVVNQLVYALLVREHVLLHGPSGTGKSMLSDYFFGAFDQSERFSIALTKFMNESALIGVPNAKILREEGRIFHDRTGTLLDADFAEFDEFFDANDFLQRVLLGVMNERKWKRGGQVEDAKLHTAFATTNGSPEFEVKRNPQLGPVMDRFLFQTNVGYLQEDESRRRMFANFLEHKRPITRIAFPDLKVLAGAVHEVDASDPVLIELHNQIMRQFAKERSVTISDRRECFALKLVQANAILFGRTVATPNDFTAGVWAVCAGEEKEAQTVYAQIATKLIGEVLERREPDIVRTQMLLLDELEKRMPQPLPEGNETLSSGQLVALRRSLNALGKEVADVPPSHVAVSDRLKRMLASIEKMKGEVGDQIDGDKPR